MGARPFGRCKICMKMAELSEEHIPPKSAFNNYPILAKAFQTSVSNCNVNSDMIEYDEGYSMYTLCVDCNNKTGGNYGTEFVTLIKTLFEKASQFPVIEFRELPLQIKTYPLRIIKQIITMFISVLPDKLLFFNPCLRYFVLNREARGLPDNYHIYMYYNPANRGRIFPLINTGSLKSHTKTKYIEIGFHPIGFLMTIDGEATIKDLELQDLSFMSKYGYKKRKKIDFKLFVLPITSDMPMCFGSHKQEAKSDNNVKTDSNVSEDEIQDLRNQVTKTISDAYNDYF